MGRGVIKKRVVYHTSESTTEIKLEDITEIELRSKGAIKRLDPKSNLISWHVPFGVKHTLAQLLADYGVTYQSGKWQSFYSNSRQFYRRNEKPELLLFSEAVEMAKTLNISLDKLHEEFKNRKIVIFNKGE